MTAGHRREQVKMLAKFTPWRPLLKLIRKPIVLALILCLSFTYCLISLLKDNSSSSSSASSQRDLEDYDMDKMRVNLFNIRRGGQIYSHHQPHPEMPQQPVHLGNNYEAVDVKEGNESEANGALLLDPGVKDAESCRNSVQGKVLISDDRGYVCLRKDTGPGGCCDPDAASTRLHSCETCLENGCCAIYEYCISCCLEPGKKPLLKRLLAGPGQGVDVLFASITDHFELCLAKCRTSSQSVQHENSYRDPKAKHCYGETPLGPSSHQPIVKPKTESNGHEVKRLDHSGT